MNEILTVKNLNHVYGEGTPFERHALRDVSFSVKKGEVIGIIGHTGSGKSTLISHLNGLLKPSSGEICLNGNNIWAHPKEIRTVRFQVGLVFQYPEYQLFEDTVEKDIAFGPSNIGITGQALKSRVRNALNFVGLPEQLLGMSPFELSGGQKRRVAIAGIIAMEPEILILDEPTAGLDPVARMDLLDHIMEYRRKTGCTVLLVSHSMEEISKVSDQILVMNQGSVAMFDSPSVIFSNGERLKAMGLALPVLTDVFQILKKSGLPVDTSVITVEDGVRALLALRGNGRSDANA